MVRGLSDRSGSLLEKVKDTALRPDQWAEEFYKLVKEGHREGWRLGRQRSGDFTDSSITDALVGRAKADAMAEYIHGFAQRLRDGAYGEGDDFKESLAKNHADLYLKQSRGTANEAFAESSEAAEEFDWVLGAVEKHCSECPQYASMNPWVKEELVTYPGSGGTPCMTNCLCSLVRNSDGISGFKPVSLARA